jgi:glutaminyl-peptide cyclotransferase
MKNAIPLSSLFAAGVLSLLAWGAGGCSKGPAALPADASGAEAPAQAIGAADSLPNYTYEVVNTYPHDRGAFTEGLTYLDGILLESTGLNGSSTLRKVELKTGRVIQQVRMPPEYFGEGTTYLGDRIFQLTWQNQKGFLYDLRSMEPEGEFAYTGEGWGLTTDGRSLIMSDGSNQIRFLDPKTFQVSRSISVFIHGRPLRMLNELEYIKGEIFANIWQTQFVVRIDPSSGRVLGLIDFTGLLAPGDYDEHTDVFNGIAYDPAGDRIFVTGKNWPKLFEVRLKPK